jgi:hypothetical protein
MNSQASNTKNRAVCWFVAVLLIVNVGLADIAIVAAVSSLITVPQLMVIAFTVALIDCGVLITAWRTGQVG